MRDYKQMQEIQRLKAQESEKEREGETEQDAAERESDRYAHRSPGFSGWFAYIREYYKWPILIGLILAVAVIAGTVQLHANSNPDLAMMYVGPYYLTAAERTKMENSLTSLDTANGGDYNQDGEFRFDFLDLTIAYLKDADGKQYLYDEQNNAYTRFQTELRAGDALLYFLQPRYYKQAKNEGILQPLDELGIDPSLSFDGYGIYIGELDGYALEGFTRMPANTVVCLRRSPDKDAIAYGRTVENWEHHRDMLLHLVNYRDPEQTAVPTDALPDVKLFTVGSEPVIRSFRSPAEQLLASLSEDANGDGMQIGRIESLTRAGSNAQREVIAKQIRTELVTGDSFLWLLDEASFRYACEKELLTPLPSGLADTDAAVDGYGLRLSGLTLSGAEGFRFLEQNLILCLRRSPKEDVEPYGRTVLQYEQAQKIFLQLAKYEN